jgi:putative peptide zinc metalloprotease protein
MSDALLSPSWYRIARLKPRIREHVVFHRHHYRGQLWYVLQDHATARCHRLTPAAYQMAGLMNGERTANEIWEAVSSELGDEGPTQDEMLRLLGLLHFADVLQSDVTPDTMELLRRSQRRDGSEWWRRYANPMSIKIPLFDPDEFLERWLPVVRPLFSWPAAVVWCGVVITAIVMAASHASELAANPPSQLFDPGNLLLLWFVYPLIKAVHELGHAFATKVWGGEVHEIGVLFLVLMPIPYVDASAATVFPEKARRVVVSAAGVGVEVFLAAVALIVWLNIEPGLVRSIAFDVMWIGTVSTLLFNGNPLMRFDGYYVLADLVEIPNLNGRSREYMIHLAMKYLMGVKQTRNPVHAPGEARWFIGYGVPAAIYRLFITFGIAFYLAGRFFVVGVLLALFALVMQVLVPLVRVISFVLTSQRLAQVRSRAILTSAAIAAGLLVLFLMVPVPLRTVAEGVVWPPEGAQVRAGADGFVVQMLVTPQALVSPGDPLILTRDPTLETRVRILEAKLRELQARHHGERRSDLVRSQITEEEIQSVKASLALARERVGDVLIRSPGTGTFVMAQALDLSDRYVTQGELIGYVVGAAITTARVVVPQSHANLVREHTQAVDLRLASRVGKVHAARILREVPAAIDRLPNPALGTAGGGRLAIDPSDPARLKTLETVFQLDVSIPVEANVREIGERVYVRFDHGSEPVALRTYRAIRRLLLSQIGV